MDGVGIVTQLRRPDRPTRCGSCGAAIVWAITEGGGRMPVDAEPTPEGNLRLFRKREGGTLSVVVCAPGSQPRLFRPHFATCPDTESWRRRRSG
jgi:hypothetical protein